VFSQWISFHSFSSSSFIFLLPRGLVSHLSQVPYHLSPTPHSSDVGDDSDDSGHCETASSCNGLIVTIFSSAISLSSVRNTVKDVLAIGITGSQALSAFSSWQGGAGFTADIVNTDLEIMNVDFTEYKVLYMPSSSLQTGGGISCAHLALVANRSSEIISFVNTLKGSLITLTQDGCSSSGYTFLAAPLESISLGSQTVTIQSALSSVVTTLTPTSLDHCCYHTGYTGPVGYGGLDVLAIDTNTGIPIILGGWNVILTAEICNDGIDNDNDGLIDQADPDCNERLCADGIDNNGNGLTDCDDPACLSSWPPCLRDLELNQIQPQLNCQGSLELKNDTVSCLQIGKFQRIFDFYKYPSQNINNTATSTNTSGVTNTPTPSPTDTSPPTSLSFSPSSSPTFVPTSTPTTVSPPTIRSFSITGREAIEDTTFNCGYDSSTTSFSTSQFLYTSNLHSNPTHLVGRYSTQSTSGAVTQKTPYFMLQKYSLPLSQLRNKSLTSAFLFQKGQPFGNGSTAFLYPTRVNWFEENVTCDSLIASGQSIFHQDCYDVGPVEIPHLYGWTYVNLTAILICQLNALFNSSPPSLSSSLPWTLPQDAATGFGSEEVSLSYLWMQDSVSVNRQGWYSSESLYSPLLVFFYEDLLNVTNT
jgi:hypothetical protein